jgi:hypothetical protein
VIIAEHRSEEAYEKFDLVGLEKILVQDLEGRRQEANGLGSCNRIATVAVAITGSGGTTIEPWGYPKLDRRRPVTDSYPASAGILDCCK